MDYQPRIADQQLDRALAALGAVVIEGPRACGKTETARRRAASEVLLDLDAEALEAADIDPRLVLDGDVPRLIDEWQRRPRIWDAVRREVDTRRARGQFILTGSATPSDDAIRHSGAGRMAIVTMRPMTLYEQHASTGTTSLAAFLNGDGPGPAQCGLGLADYAERIVIGGWPGLLGASVPDAMQFMKGYVDLIADHDIALESGTRRDPHLVRRFLHAYAQVTAHPSRLNTIVRRAQEASEEGHAPSRWSAAPYLDALRRLMVVDEVPAWDPELRSRARLIRTPKRHLVDPSLSASLLSCDPSRLLHDLTTFGFLFESLATRDIRVYAEASDASVFHYREHTGALEVDLVVERIDGTWIGVEVKLGGTPLDDAAVALRRLAADRVRRPPAALVVVTATSYAYRRDDGVYVVPLGVLGP